MMKRSEAIQILSQYIDRYTGVPLHPDSLLDYIEKEVGMIPPGDKYTVHGLVTYLNNEWDKE
jgi:hypothetical protein